MINRRIKRLALFSIFLYLFLVNTKYTDADLSAERIVLNNNFSIISLDFFTKASFNSNQITSLFHTAGLQPSGFDLGAIKIKSAAKSFKYHAKVVVLNGNTALCQALNLKVFDRNFSRKFNGSLTDFSFNSLMTKNESKDWIFVISLDNNQQNLKNKICEFNFNFRTYRNNVNEQGGIFAERKVRNVISSGNW